MNSWGITFAAGLQWVIASTPLLSMNIVAFFDKEPSILWDMYAQDDDDDHDDDTDKQRLFFFTHRTKLSASAKRFNRKVGGCGGTWSNLNSKKITLPKNKTHVIRVKRELRFDGGSHSGAWLMTLSPHVELSCSSSCYDIVAQASKQKTPHVQVIDTGWLEEQLPSSSSSSHHHIVDLTTAQASKEKMVLRWKRNSTNKSPPSPF